LQVYGDLLFQQALKFSALIHHPAVIICTLSYLILPTSAEDPKTQKVGSKELDHPAAMRQNKKSD